MRSITVFAAMASLGALVTLTHAVDSDERFEVFDNTALGPGEEFFFATSASLINDVDAAAVALAKTSIEECKSRCEFFDNCYALVYNGPEVATGADCQYFHYDANGLYNRASDFQYFLARYNTPIAPTCFYATDFHGNDDGKQGTCYCGGETEIQDTKSGCRVPLPASQANNRKKRAAKQLRPQW